MNFFLFVNEIIAFHNNNNKHNRKRKRKKRELLLRELLCGCFSLYIQNKRQQTDAQIIVYDL